MTERCHDVVVVGDESVGAELCAAGLDVVVAGRTVRSAVFDDGTGFWTLTTDDGDSCRARMVVAGDSPLAAFIPDLFGRRDFRGISFHAATPAPDFDPAGRRVAVIGADSNAGRLIEKVVGSADQVKVFLLPPRRVVPRSRRAVRFARRRAATVISSPFEELTTAGVRTADGVHHDADALVYGTGFAVAAGAGPLVGPGGRTLQQIWIDGAEPYLGVALQGLPNYFTLGGPDHDAALQSVIACLRLAAGNARIEVRRSSQQVFNERAHLIGPPLRPLASAFDLTPSLDAPGDIYDGAATLTLAGACRQVRVRLAGHVDPIDGQYHWQGTVFDKLSEDLVKQGRAVSLAIGGRTTPARITEKTPQETHSIAGVGLPPFALAEIEGLPHV